MQSDSQICSLIWFWKMKRSRFMLIPAMCPLWESEFDLGGFCWKMLIFRYLTCDIFCENLSRIWDTVEISEDTCVRLKHSQTRRLNCCLGETITQISFLIGLSCQTSLVRVKRCTCAAFTIYTTLNWIQNQIKFVCKDNK